MDPLSHLCAFILGELGLLLGLTLIKRGPHRVVTVRRTQFRHELSGTISGTTGQSILVFIHGGGWHAGTIDSTTRWWTNVSYYWLGETLATRGVHVALISYPLCYTPDHVRYGFYIGLAIFSVILAKALSCVVGSLLIWCVLAVPCYVISALSVRSRAMPPNQTQSTNVQIQLDTVQHELYQMAAAYPSAQFILVGHSAGAHLAALASQCRNDRLRFRVSHIVGLSGPYRPETLYENVSPWLRTITESFLPQEFAHNTTIPMSLSPYLTIETLGSTSNQTWLLMTAQADAPILIKQTEQFAKLLKEKQNSTVRVVYDCGMGHGRGMVLAEQVWTPILELLNK